MRLGIALLGALLLLLGSYVIAQEIAATILGTVTDSSGAVVSGATITVVNTDQAKVVRRLATSSSGEYVVPLIPLGFRNEHHYAEYRRYRVSVKINSLQ